MLTTDGCCGSIVVGWKRPPQDPFMRTAMCSAPPPLLPPPPPPTPPPSNSASSQLEEHPWSALVTPAAHLPNFRYSRDGKARFTAQEWAVVQSFMRWLVGSAGHQAEWRYEASADGVTDREAGIIHYLRGIHITPCLSYLLEHSLERDATSPLPTLTIDVGAFAIEVAADRGVVSGISLVHESGHREAISPASAEVELRRPHVVRMERALLPPVDRALLLTLLPVSGHELVVRLEVLVP